MEKTNRLDTYLNVATLLVAIFVAGFLVFQYFRPAGAANAPGNASLVGMRVDRSTIDPAPAGTTGSTLVFTLSSGCRYCTESAPFYKALLTQHKGAIRFVAVLPQPAKVSQEYLRSLDLEFPEVIQATLPSLHVSGTPTLLLLDRSGVIRKSWQGKLSPDAERDVIRTLNSGRAS